MRRVQDPAPADGHLGQAGDGRAELHLLPELNVIQNTMIPALVGMGRLRYARERKAINDRAADLLSRLADDPRVDREIAELCERASHRLDLAPQDKHHVPRP